MIDNKNSILTSMSIGSLVDVVLGGNEKQKSTCISSDPCVASPYLSTIPFPFPKICIANILK